MDKQTSFRRIVRALRLEQEAFKRGFEAARFRLANGHLAYRKDQWELAYKEFKMELDYSKEAHGKQS